jgi:hypothetical protein
MDQGELIKRAFRDELSKIAMVRSGSMPMTAKNMAGVSNHKKANKNKSLRPRNLMKIGAIVAGIKPKALGAMGVSAGLMGAYGVHKAEQAVDDYKTGKTIRERRGG